MPIVISELIKKCRTFEVNKFIGSVFDRDTSCDCKILDFNNSIENYEKASKILIYNFLDTFTVLKKLIISDMSISFIEIEVIEKIWKNWNV